MIRLLFIEPDPFLALIFLKEVRKTRFDVRHASHAEEAWRMLATEPADLIVTELVLPRQTGFEFLEELRAREEYAQTDVAIHSRLGSRDDIHRCQELGATNYFIKAHHRPHDVVRSLEQQWAVHPSFV